MKKFLVKHSATIIGWIAAALGVSTVGWFTPTGEVNLLAVAFGLAFAVFAYFTKARAVTGGTVPATKEAEERTTPAATLPPTK